MDTNAETSRKHTAILIVEDDEVLSELLRAVLNAEGYQVSCAATGAQARQQLANSRFDLLLLDIRLPDTTGIDLLPEIASRHSSTRVIVMTQDTTSETMLRVIREHAFDYIPKPFAVPEILQLVDNTLEYAAVPEIEVLSGLPHWVELLVPCDLGAAHRVQGFLARMEVDLPESMRNIVGQAFRELLTNAVEWGGKLDPTRRVRIAYVRTPRMIQYRIADPGQGFQFEKLQHAAINNPDDDPFRHTVVREEQGLRPGGLGLMLVRAMADELVYNERQNEVIFIKYLDK